MFLLNQRQAYYASLYALYYFKALNSDETNLRIPINLLLKMNCGSFLPGNGIIFRLEKDFCVLLSENEYIELSYDDKEEEIIIKNPLELYGAVCSCCHINILNKFCERAKQILNIKDDLVQTKKLIPSE